MSLTHDLALRLGGVRSALGDPNMARLLFAWGAWSVTGWAFLIAVSVTALEAGGPAALGLVGAARVLPAAIASGAVSALSDRVPQSLLLAAVNGSWCVFTLVMVWFAVTDAPTAALLVLLAVGSAVSAVLKPCVQAMLPTLVRQPGELIVANSALSTVDGVGTVLGPALCGVLLASSGPVAVFAVLAVLYAAAAWAGGTIRSPFQPVRPLPGHRRRAWTAPGQGFRLLTATGPRAVYLLFVLQTVMRGFLNVFVVLVATGGASGDQSRAGGLFAAIGVGGLVGALVGMSGSGGRSGVSRFAVGIALWGVPIAVIGWWTGHTVAWWALAVLGVGKAFAEIYGFSLLNRLIPHHVAGRAWGAFHSSGAAGVALGSVLAPLLVTTFGLSETMIVAGAVLAVAPLVAIPALRAVGVLARARSGDVELIASVALFAPLSPISVEGLARAAREVRVDPGQVVVTEHGVAEDFYVIAEGEFSVWQSQVELRRLGPSDSFGEIALLQSGPRTAAVVAETSGRLLTLDRESFVAAVTGHRPTDDLVRRSVDQRLTADRLRRTYPSTPTPEGD